MLGHVEADNRGPGNRLGATWGDSARAALVAAAPGTCSGRLFPSLTSGVELSVAIHLAQFNYLIGRDHQDFDL